MCAGIFLQSLLGMSVATVACFPRTTAVGCRNYSCYSFDSFSLEYVKCEVIFCLEINDAASARVKLSSLRTAASLLTLNSPSRGVLGLLFLWSFCIP